MSVGKEKRKMGSDQWVTVAILLVIALAAGLLIHAFAPGAINTWFDGFLQHILSAVPTT